MSSRDFSLERRVTVQISCPHGVFPDGSRRYVLKQNRVIRNGPLETRFAGPAELDAEGAVWLLEGRGIFDHERQMGFWELKKHYGPARAGIAESFRSTFEWTKPEQTMHVCNLCMLNTRRPHGKG